MRQPDQWDYSDLTWSAAFAALCACFKREYVFTHWKALDWDARQSAIAPRIEAAQASSDTQAYYCALREFVYAIPDANLRIWGDSWNLHRAAVNGSYGLSVVELADGQVLASDVVPDKTAARAGIQRGALIISWNEFPIRTALHRTNVMWADQPSSTSQQHRARQCRFLTHASPGTTARIEFQNPKRNRIETAELTAEPCEPEQAPAGTPTGQSHAPIEHQLLSTNVGLLTLRALPEESLPASLHHAIYDHWRASLASFLRGGAVALIIDLRHCVGGNHALAARLAGCFYQQPLFYAVAGYLQNSFGGMGKLKRDPQTLLQIIPGDIYWQAPVAVIINADTMGAAEGLAAALQHSPRARIIGAGSSGGALGTLTPDGLQQVWMPEGYSITFLVQAVLNQDGVIRLESNRFGEGGVQPNVLVPQNLRAFQEKFILGQDVELAFALHSLIRSPRALL